MIAEPSADSGEYTVRSVVLAISREPSRNFSVSSSPWNLIVMTVPRAASVAVVGGSPTVALRSRSVSCRIRASCLPCSSFAAW
jgi:hypothetical protein